LAARVSELESKLEDVYYAPGMPGYVAVHNRFDGNVRQRDW